MSPERTQPIDYTVGSVGPLIIVRYQGPWRVLLKSLTPVMHAHGLRQKDLLFIERVDIQTERIDQAMAGDVTVLPEFWFYEHVEGSFTLRRRGAR